MRPLIFLLPLLTACALQKAPGKACTYNDECGSGEACVGGGCTEVECIASTDCGIQQYCSSKRFECKDGCESDDDCIAGEQCDTDSHECKEYGCRDTQLDCPLGEFCDTTTGICYQDDQDNCKTCEWLQSETCAGGGICAIWELTEDNCSRDSDCDDGLVCGDFTLYGLGKVCYNSFCLQQCDAGDDNACPRGYECAAVFEGDTQEYCYGDCGWLQKYGYAREPGAPARSVAPHGSLLERTPTPWAAFSPGPASSQRSLPETSLQVP
jgi:hypothetical protein